MNENLPLPGFEAQQLVKPFKFPSQPHEYKVTSLRECPTPESLQLCDTPEKAAQYWDLHISTNPYFDPERECFAVLLLNTPAPSQSPAGAPSIRSGTQVGGSRTFVQDPREPAIRAPPRPRPQHGRVV
jgi:hypothetical protein